MWPLVVSDVDINQYLIFFEFLHSEGNLYKGLIPRAIFLGEMRKFSREITARMRHKGK
jgi:hypothetical protein